MRDFVAGLIIGMACVFSYLNHYVGNHDEIMAGIECSRAPSLIDKG